MSNKSDEIKKKILKLTAEYCNLSREPVDFDPLKTRLPYAGRVFDEKEVVNLVDSSLEFWLTYGRYSKKFEKNLANYLGLPYAFLVNSGSSANLLAVAALTSPLLGEKRLLPGDEVITVAAAFPTTVAPLIQMHLTPVFIDVSLPSYNIDCSRIEAAISKKTKAVMLAHTLGNPFDIDKIKAVCNKHGLWLIEDNCDSLGSIYKGRPTGSFGDIGTSSFYPPHHITMGEGGAVYTANNTLAKIIASLRDWGRDCRCPSGLDDTCARRFSQQFGELPQGYDHKYVYSHFGYNLKVSDMQAAVGCAQLDKLPGFIDARRRNFAFIYDHLSDLNDRLILPEATEGSEPSWFGFLITVKEGAGFKRGGIVDYLEHKRIQTRMLFAGNILKHPCFDEMRTEKKGYRVVGDLKNSNLIMNNSFWVGVYPGLDSARLHYMVMQIRNFIEGT